MVVGVLKRQFLDVFRIWIGIERICVLVTSRYYKYTQSLCSTSRVTSIRALSLNIQIIFLSYFSFQLFDL